MSGKKTTGRDKRGAPHDESRQLLVSGARQLGVSLDSTTVESFERFLEALIRWNHKMNLTALRDRRSIVVRHFLDSLTLMGEIPAEGCLLDIGSGAGFPGIPLKIAMPALQVTLLEASRKKTYFHRHVIRTLGLSGIQTLWGRSDQDGVRKGLFDHFDIVVSRAALSLERFLKHATPFVHTQGVIVAMRVNPGYGRVALDSLSLELCRTVSVALPFDRVKRSLLFFKKAGNDG